jgi:glyoxylase-like metal-dependent hydrolase (beta-lactamase superfamily II)
MKAIQLCVNPFEMNCYIYHDDNSCEGILIDPGVFSEKEKQLLKSTISDKNINIKYIINTHGHLDHILGNSFAKETYNVPLLMHKDDLHMINNCKVQAEMFGIEVTDPPQPDEFITEETRLKVGETELEFLHTPGHSPGSICIIDHANKHVICGDLIFKNSIGRTDLPGGDFDILLASIDKLFSKCSDEYILHPGHMDFTTIHEEKLNNPFLNRF